MRLKGPIAQMWILCTTILFACVSKEALAQGPFVEGSVPVAIYDDSYDPFSDFSEFEQQTDEEEDINFFRNGRFLTVGLLLGYRGFTENMGKIYSPAAHYGISATYFFSLQFALEFSYQVGDHHWAFNYGSYSKVGTAGFTDMGLNFKYYFNTDNVTKGLADLSPYAKVGISQLYRNVVFTDLGFGSPDSAQAVNFGAGLEIPILKNNMFIGIQGLYQYFSMPDEGMQITYESNGATISTGVAPNGDSFTLMGLLGINF